MGCVRGGRLDVECRAADLLLLWWCPWLNLPAQVLLWVP